MNWTPEHAKTDKIIGDGYDESHYGPGYWLSPTENGTRRIDRDGTLMINLAERLVQLETLPQEPRVADVGAGPGRVVSDFKARGFGAVGFEYSESGRKLARERFGIELLPCDLRKHEGVSCPDAFLHFVMCIGVLSMIPLGSLETAAKELARILHRRGVLLVSILNTSGCENNSHISSLTHPEWRKLLIDAGLEDITSIWPPQKCGIGTGNEFCGLFRKAP